MFGTFPQKQKQKQKKKLCHKSDSTKKSTVFHSQFSVDWSSMKSLNNVTFCGLLRNTLKSVLHYSSKITHMVMSVFMKIEEHRIHWLQQTARIARIARSDAAFCEWEGAGRQLFSACNCAVRRDLSCFENRNGEKYLTESLMISIPHPMLFGSSNGEEWDGRGV